MGCRPKAHTFLEIGDLLRSGTSLVNFLTEFILQNPHVRFRKWVFGVTGYLLGDEQSTSPSWSPRTPSTEWLCSHACRACLWASPPTWGARRGRLGTLRALQHLGVPSAPRRILDEPLAASTTPPQGQGQVRMKKGPSARQICLNIGSTVSTLKDACLGLRMAHASDGECARGNVEPYLEEIKYSPGPSHVLK